MNKILSIALIIIWQISFGQSIKNLKLNNKQSILKDRVYLTFPKSAKNINRSISIMSHNPNPKKETRIVLNNGKEKLIFFAEELFTLGNKKLLHTLKSMNNKNFGFEYSKIKNTTNITAIQSVPRKWDKTKDAILINSLTVMTKDSTLLQIDAYINPKAYNKQKDNYINLTKKIFKTIKKGTRLNNLKAKRETHKIFGTNKKFVFKLPRNTIIQVDQKYNFQVFRIKTFNKINNPSLKSITIYTGHHPSYFYSNYGFKNYTNKQKTTFLNESNEWLYFENKEKKIYLKEQKIRKNIIEQGIIVHIALIGSSSKIIDDLTQLIENIKLLN